MYIQIIIDFLLLMGLGLVGWYLLAKIRMPAAEVLGPVLLIGAMRALHLDLPLSPPFLFSVVQVVIGIFIGSMLNRETVRELKPMVLPALIVIGWALSIIFIIGFFLARYTALDLYTAMLSASMGGLPEITIIAMASGAGVAVIVVTQMLRLLITIFTFPLILKWFENKIPGSINSAGGTDTSAADNLAGSNRPEKKGKASLITAELKSRIKMVFSFETLERFHRSIRISWARILFTLAVAASGGLLFMKLGVPAGLLVGATVFIAAVSITGAEISRLSPRLFDLLLVYIGITIADHISFEMISTMGNRDLLVPILIATAIIFATSFLTSWVICKVTKWDYPTCFLSAAPSGFTLMTVLAVKYGLDPIKVSMLHLCRLLSIKLFLPFLFMYLMSR